MAPIPQCIIAQDLLTPSTFGALVAAVEYGALLVISRRGPSRKALLALRVWIVVAATSTFALQITWLALRPAANSALGSRLYLALNALYVLLSWTADAVVIWRALKILRRSIVIQASSACLHMCNIVLSCLFLAHLSESSPQTWNITRAFCVSYRTISLALSVSMTLAIIVCLWRASRQISPFIVNGTAPYVSISWTLLLAAVIDAIPAISYIVCVGVSNSAQMFFLPILGQAQALTPLLVMYCAAWRAKSESPILQNETAMLTGPWASSSAKGTYQSTLDSDANSSCEKVSSSILSIMTASTRDPRIGRITPVLPRISTDINYKTLTPDLYHLSTASDDWSLPKSPLHDRPLDSGPSKVTPITRASAF